MNELEIKEKSAVMCRLSQEISIQNQEDLANAVEILKGVKNHRKKVVEYWKTAKESAKKTYDEIRLKEKEMLNVCDETLWHLKNEILGYKFIQEKKAAKLSDEAENYKKQEVEKLLNESIEAQEKGDEITAECKLQQAEMIENLEKYTAKIFRKSDGIGVKKLWQARIWDNESVPAFFNGVEIREISTKKLLEIRKNNPKVEIPGVEFYQEESLAVRT